MSRLALGVLGSGSSGSSAPAVSLTRGRINASADLANTAFVTAALGTRVPFNATVYGSGTTFSGTTGIIPSQSGLYRCSWYMQVGSGDVAGDGTFHVVQNGVSLGSVFIDMMQAAGVNQIAQFLEVNLVAGAPVELRYQPAVADSLPWGRGSYFDVSQLPTSVSTLVANGTATNDQTALKYFDVGSTRYQWGQHNDGNLDPSTVTLNAPFANAEYVVIPVCSSGAAGSCSTEAKTTTTFDIDRASTFATAQTWDWFAIGQKPAV